MQVKCIVECSKWSILQYFRPSLSYQLLLRSLLCLFLSGRFTQVLLYRHLSTFLCGQVVPYNIIFMKNIRVFASVLK